MLQEERKKEREGGRERGRMGGVMGCRWLNTRCPLKSFYHSQLHHGEKTERRTHGKR